MIPFLMGQSFVILLVPIQFSNWLQDFVFLWGIKGLGAGFQGSGSPFSLSWISFREQKDFIVFTSLGISLLDNDLTGNSGVGPGELLSPLGFFTTFKDLARNLLLGICSSWIITSGLERETVECDLLRMGSLHVVSSSMFMSLLEQLSLTMLSLRERSQCSVFLMRQLRRDFLEWIRLRSVEQIQFSIKTIFLL